MKEWWLTTSSKSIPSEWVDASWESDHSPLNWDMIHHNSVHAGTKVHLCNVLTIIVIIVSIVKRGNFMHKYTFTVELVKGSNVHFVNFKCP